MPRKAIWLAIFASTVIYAVIVFTIAREPQRTFNESLRLPLVLAMHAAALVTLAMSFLVPPRISHPRPRFIVRLALTEAVALYGVMAAILAHDWRLYLGPWAIALIGFLQAWPSSSEEAQ